MSDTIRWVRITSVPAGEAPEWARQAWVGVELPDLGIVPTSSGLGLVTRKPNKERHERFIVSARVAIDALALKNPQAADWFRVHMFGDKFGFRRSEVTAIPPPSPPPTTDIKEWRP